MHDKYSASRLSYTSFGHGEEHLSHPPSNYVKNLEMAASFRRFLLHPKARSTENNVSDFLSESLSFHTLK